MFAGRPLLKVSRSGMPPYGIPPPQPTPDVIHLNQYSSWPKACQPTVPSRHQGVKEPLFQARAVPFILYRLKTGIFKGSDLRIEGGLCSCARFPMSGILTGPLRLGHCLPQGGRCERIFPLFQLRPAAGRAPEVLLFQGPQPVPADCQFSANARIAGASPQPESRENPYIALC